MSELTSNTVQIDEIFLARPLTTPAMIGILIALIVLSVYLYRRASGLRPWQRVFLGVLRVVILGLVCITLLEPMAVVRQTNTQQRGLPVLVDISESMTMKDQRKSTADLVEAAAALDLLSDTESGAEQAALGLGVKQRQAIATSSRLDLATNLLSRSARSTLALLGYEPLRPKLRLPKLSSLLPTRVEFHQRESCFYPMVSTTLVHSTQNPSSETSVRVVYLSTRYQLAWLNLTTFPFAIS